MDARSAQLEAAEPVCLKAIRRFAAELARQTPLRLTVSGGEADVVFDGHQRDTTIHVEWRRGDQDQDDPLQEYDDRIAGDPPWGTADCDSLIAHYHRTVEALARNPEAARKTLDLLKRT